MNSNKYQQLGNTIRRSLESYDKFIQNSIINILFCSKRKKKFFYSKLFFPKNLHLEKYLIFMYFNTSNTVMT